MNFDTLGLGPLLRATLRRKFSTLLVVIQIAITMAIITNALHIVYERVQLMQRASGLDENNSFYFTSSGFAQGFNPANTIGEDLQRMRDMPGVVAVVQSNSFPLLDGGNWAYVQTQAGEHNKIPAAVYKVDEQGLQAFAVELVAGENFNSNEVIWQQESDNGWPAQVILSKALAINLSSAQNWQQLLGTTIYIDLNQPLVVKGIMDHLQVPWVESPNINNTILVPAIVANQNARYFVRAEKGYLPQLMADIPAVLASSNKQRVIRNINTVAQARDSIYATDKAIIWILLLITLVLTLVTAMGITGLASFNVNKRRKQIGTRRALGASRGNIVGYFMLENLLLSGIGVIIGAGLTLGLNIQLLALYELPVMSWHYIPAGMAMLIVLGQLAVLWPATRASLISPALASRCN